ncbi:MAG: hypothetical protein ACFFCW_06985 [Candidatus Hodarchaeota archaeon]
MTVNTDEQVDGTKYAENLVINSVCRTVSRKTRFKEDEMSFFDLSESQEGMFDGGTGETIEDAVIINTTNTMVGVPAEYHYVSSKCGQQDVDWFLKSQEYMPKEGRHYDVLEIELKNGELKSYYFDITKFFGKL